MRDSLSYKGYVGSVHFNADDEVFYGKIAGVTDLVTFEGITVAGLAASFREAVEDYLVLCRTVGKPARKSYKVGAAGGTSRTPLPFWLRVPP